MLIRNTEIEKALNCKMHSQYLGPLIVISCNQGGAYIIAELDGAVFDRPIAVFQVIPYFTRIKIELPPLDRLINISKNCLMEMEATDQADPDDDIAIEENMDIELPTLLCND